MMGTGQSAVTKDSEAYKESKRKFQKNVPAMDYSKKDKKKKKKRKKNKVDTAVEELVGDLNTKER